MLGALCRLHVSPAGPLIGVGLLHLKDFSRKSIGMMSIGGAGTFDGIVLTGVVAACLA